MKEILLGGLGGQGVLTAGIIISEIAIFQDMNATWSPEYGSAMRGGTANCTVKFGQERIYNPTKEAPDLLLAMNDVAFNQYLPLVKDGGTVVVNSDMVDVDESNILEDIKIVKVPCVSIAESINHPLGANIIMCGVILRLLEDISLAEATDGMNSMFKRQGKERFEEKNTEALKCGFDFISF